MFLLVGAVIYTSLSIAQKKELTLNDAVLQQYRALAPDKISMFQWIPNSNEYIFIENKGKTLMKASTDNTTALIWFTLDEVNKALNAKLNWFSGLEWKDQTNFYLNDGSNYYVFNTTSKRICFAESSTS